jgi:uncharacterized OB-fold protein
MVRDPMDSKISVKEYLAALKENRLLGVKCRECGFVTAPPRLACRQCAGHITDLTQLSGKGRVASFTSVFLPPESHRGKAPYLVVMVELDEGPWIMGNLSGVDPAAASMELIGKRVTMNNTLLSGKDMSEKPIAPLFVLD